MKKTILWIAALLAVTTLAGCNCNKEQTSSVENAEIANPASVYCEGNGGTLQIETGEDWSQSWICMFEDGSYCEEWSYFRWECQAGEIIYNTVEEEPVMWIANPASVYCVEQGWESIIMEDEEWNQYWVCRFADWSEVDEWEYFRANNPAEWTSELYSEEDLAAAEAVIMNVINNEWNIKVESVELAYVGDEESAANLDYCKELANAKWEDVDECIVFTSSFYIPEQDAPMAGSFEPNTNIAWYGWYLGRATAGEWEVLTNGFG